MRLFCLLLALITFNAHYGQAPVLLDTLNLQQKKSLKEVYNKRKEQYYTSIEPRVSKSEFKEVKSAYNDTYQVIEKRIDNNIILVNSPLNLYLNNLLSSIQKKNPNAPQNINLLVSRKFETNAANAGEGTIIVNNYLLADLDNEDELAFIICHEMAHQALDHSLKSIIKYINYNNSDELKSKAKELKKQKYNTYTQAEDLLKSIAYKNSSEHREKEIQADSLGFYFYSHLGRNVQQPLEALKRLRDSDVEPDSLTIKDYTKIFSSFGITAKDEWFVMEDYNMYHYKENTKFNTDSLRTHPNCDERIAALTKQFPQIEQQTTNKDVFPSISAEFTKWKNNAVYQNIYNTYLLEDYGNSLYESLKLYNRKPDDFLKKMIGLNFQKLYDAKKTYKLNRYVSQVNTHLYTDSYNLFSTFIFNLSLANLETFTKAFKPAI